MPSAPGSSAAAGVSSHQQSRSYQFPPGFLWGAATASHQVEGGNIWNDWWEYEQRGKVPYASGDACRQYELFENDFDLARAWSHTAHRFSMEWSRLEPEEGRWNDDAIAHYRDVIRALRLRGLEPVVTLHHFTNPAWFIRRGGWSRNDSPRLFARYVDRVITTLGEPVRYWLTINEPTVYVMQGFIMGDWPPCMKQAWMHAARVFRNLARGHVDAYRILHQADRNVMVGFAHSAPVIEPCDPRSRRDRTVAWVRDYVLNRAFFRLIGAHPQPAPAARSLDFIGINYYTRNIVRSSGLGLGAVVGRMCTSDHHERGAVSTLGWEVYPRGLVSTLERFAEYGVPLLVTENGIATDDEALRREFLLEHVAAAGEAVDKGVNLLGYLYWSLIDNFEWAAGTSAKFGLASVDSQTQQRRARPCVADFIRICRDNRL
jgi:beta-glucosidase